MKLLKTTALAFAVSGLLASSFSAGAASLTAKNSPSAFPGKFKAHGKADLVILRAHLRLAQVCKKFKPVMYGIATVKNIGNAPSTAKLNVGMVNAMDTHLNWGNGIGLKSLKPGQLTTVKFPIYYLVSKPGHMPGFHKFKFTVNKGKWISESNYNNNTKMASILVKRGFCKGGKKPDLIAKLAKPMNGKVLVRNIGAGAAGKSLLLLKCVPASGVPCASHPAMASYKHPAYPNYVVVKVPALAPGQMYGHKLSFWKKLKWRKGKFRFIAIADGGKHVPESNEANNTAWSWLAK